MMYDPQDGALETIGGYLHEPLRDLLTDGGVKKQIVGQAELVPCLAAKVAWKKRMRSLIRRRSSGERVATVPARALRPDHRATTPLPSSALVPVRQGSS